MDRTALLAATLLALAPLPVAAAEIEGVRFADSIQVGDERLALRSVGLLRYRVIFRAYVAALYVDPSVPSQDVLSDVPKRLEIEYFWAIDGDDFGGAADQLLAEQLTPAELARLRPRLARLHALYRDVAPGDRYALTYRPGVGLELSFNGETLGTIPGADFASVYFGIWLGDRPLDAGLRDQLLADG